MKIEEGKYYRTRDGRKVGPMRLRALEGVTYVSVSDEDGRMDDDLFDIISEWTDEPTLWKDMTDAEKGALLLAEHRGGDVEYWSGYAWNRHSKSMPLWCDGIAYRIKPAPVVETKEHTWNWAYGFFGYDGPDDPKTTHRITFDTVDGVPDCSTVKMEMSNED